ncbi:hypothetical protein TNCV_187341 [Trichonephila clavipes]|nr:hypothetical protein TNCV_187341 [Trichonephila clavipes]
MSLKLNHKGSCARRLKQPVFSSAVIPPSANKKRIIALLGADRQWSCYMVNGLLYSNNYEGRRVTHCIEVLSLTQRWILVLKENLGKRNCKSP